MRRDTLQPVLAGVVSSLVGFAGAFTIVLTGLRAVGASQVQAASGLLALCVLMGALAVTLSWRTRMPIVIAWSTPGAALLVAAGPVHGGYRAAIGAFLLAGTLIVLAAAWSPLTRAVGAVPGALASALLAGVLVSVCVAPARSLVAHPGLTAPMILTWLVLTRVARRYAVPGALAAAVAAVALHPVNGAGAGHPLPVLVWTTPAFDARTLIGLGLPLFLVTMASQNVTGMAVLRGFGYTPDLRAMLGSTGAASVLAAPLGGHGINLAAITAALCAGPDAHPDPARRWIAALSGGLVYLPLGLGAGLATVLLAHSPPVLIEAVAGLALLGTLGAALAAASADERDRDAAMVTFAVTVSGIAVGGISAPLWGLAAGLLVLYVQRARRPGSGHEVDHIEPGVRP